MKNRVWRMAVAALLMLGFAAGLARAQSGEPVCAVCHEKHFKEIAATPHGVKADPRTPFGRKEDCRACHGDSAEHVNNPVANKPTVYFGNQPQAEQNARCESCHKGGQHMLWTGSRHDRAKVACSSCHNPHLAKDQVLVRQTQAGVCFTCHQAIRAKTESFSAHPLRQGQMQCSDCHAPHGTAGEKLLRRDTVNDTCYTCHAGKRGPFLWAHPPVQEDCANCHDPHGTNTPPMLKVRGPYLCQQCHQNQYHPSTFYNGNALKPNASGSDKMMGLDCRNCHTKVHGSNHPAGAGFTR